MKQFIIICDGCKEKITEGNIHKLNLFYFAEENKRERSRTYHLCDKCFDERLADIVEKK